MAKTSLLNRGSTLTLFCKIAFKQAQPCAAGRGYHYNRRDELEPKGFPYSCFYSPPSPSPSPLPSSIHQSNSLINIFFPTLPSARNKHRSYLPPPRPKMEIGSPIPTQNRYPRLRLDQMESPPSSPSSLASSSTAKASSPPPSPLEDDEGSLLRLLP